MPLEILDVIDTAVKVGFGAIISGIATYQVTHLNHRADKKKELAKRKVEIVTFSIEKLELYFAAFTRCYSRLNGILRSGTEPGEFPDEKLIHYRKLDSELVNARANRAIASSRLRLIGLSEAADLIDKITTIERKLRDKVIFEKQLPTNQELLALNDEINAVKMSLYEILSRAFENSYG